MASPSSAYLHALKRLVSRARFGSKPGLARINRLLTALGHPERSFTCILVAGTNGKGSTTAMMARILSKAGHRAGSYFSPSVFSFRERIQLGGKWISKKDFVNCANEVLSSLPLFSDDPPTFFEVMTAMALLHFERSGADYAVLEAGLGGRHDATNACEPALSILTSIGLEHTDVLGKTTEKIAREKGGIIRSQTPVVCAVKDQAALAEIKKTARRLRAPLYLADGKSISSLRLKTPGSFQRANAACALKAAGLMGVKSSIASRALSSFVMPARWQKISAHPRLTMDCCHNPPAAKAIQPDLGRDFSPDKNSPRVLLFSAMKDKDYAQVLALLAPHFDSIVLCRLPYQRAARLADLRKAARAAVRKSVRKKMAGPPIRIFSLSNPDSALAFSKSLASKNGRVLACGSMYLLQFLFGEREFRLTA